MPRPNPARPDSFGGLKMQGEIEQNIAGNIQPTVDSCIMVVQHHTHTDADTHTHHKHTHSHRSLSHTHTHQSCHNMANRHIAYCMQDVLYCNTDMVIIKPVTGRERIYSASLKTTSKFMAHKEEVCQHSHSSDPVPVHTICAICCNILLHIDIL